MTARDERTPGSPKRETPDEADLLLPWHTVERLSPEEAERVAAALARDPGRARHLDLAREERAGTVALNQDLGAPSRRARDNLFARIETEGRKSRSGGLARRLRAALAGLSPQTLAWSGAAAAVVIVVQAALLAGLLANAGRREPGSGYETASAPAASQEGRFALVAFEPTATAARIDSLLRVTRSILVDGPRPGGLYRLRIADKATSPEEVAALTDRLRAEPGVIRLLVPETAPGK